jgi:hypothetical protein
MAEMNKTKNETPGWLTKQLDIVEKVVDTWSLAKQEWAGRGMVNNEIDKLIQKAHNEFETILEKEIERTIISLCPECGFPVKTGQTNICYSPFYYEFVVRCDRGHRWTSKKVCFKETKE